jgi:hypothetical protein
MKDFIEAYKDVVKKSKELDENKGVDVLHIPSEYKGIVDNFYYEARKLVRWGTSQGLLSKP